MEGLRLRESPTPFNQSSDMTIQECKENVGRNVTYIPFEGCDSKLHEYGVITSVNDRYAFVRYGSDVNSKATDPSDLRLG